MTKRNNLPILRELARRFGAAQFEYVSDVWGSGPVTDRMTPRGVIELHRHFGWSDDGYRVVSPLGNDRRAVLVEAATGNPILVEPEVLTGGE